MNGFKGQVLEKDRLLFKHATVWFLGADEEGNVTGQLEIHNGGVTMLRTDRPYQLVLDDGRAEQIVLTEARQSGQAGVVQIAFRIPRQRVLAPA